MERVYYAEGGIASEDLLRSIVRNNDGWSRAVLQQCFCVSEPVIDALLKGEAEWQIKDRRTISITLQTNASP